MRVALGWAVVVAGLCCVAGRAGPGAAHSTAAAAAERSNSKATLFWVSTPVAPGETAVIVGSGFSNQSKVTVTVGAQTSALSPQLVGPASVMVTLPAELPVGAYSLTVDGSDPIVANQPDLWWVQGDAGQTATPGGWLRVFGRGLALQSSEEVVAATAAGAGAGNPDLELLLADLAAAARATDLGRVEQLADTLRRAAAGSTPPFRAGGATTTLVLTPLGDGAPVNISASPGNLTTLSAWFPLPPSLPAGTYSVGVDNGGGVLGRLSAFVSPAEPQVTSVVVAAPRAFNPKRFDVSSFGCPGGLDSSGQPVNCTAAVLAAVAAAGANAGGGTVFFPVGRWYVAGPLLLPDGVLLQGAGADLSALYFLQSNETTAPVSLIAPANHTSEYVRYGAEDLSIYVLSFYLNVFDIRADTDGVRIRRVLLRANAFHCQNMGGGARTPVWTFRGGGANPLVWIHGRNFEISDSDFWSTWSFVHSSGLNNPVISGRTYSGVRSATFGLIRNNHVYTGGSCHWFDQAQQVIFENNTCVGNNPMAMGNNIDSYGGGFAHHVYIGDNDISQVWGNDREVMTYDNAVNSYYGPVLAVSSDGKTFSTRGTDPHSHSFAQVLGGVLVVVNSTTAAGQYRRIVSYKIDNSSGSFTVERPLLAPVQPGDTIQVMAMRGRNLFFRNQYTDCGAFQFYGIGMDNIIHSVRMTRGGGFANWGQWRGFFANPNMFNQFLHNEVAEGLRAEHQGSPLGRGTWGDAAQFMGHVFAIVDAPYTWLNRFIVFRGNEARSNGGFYLGPASDVLVEGNTVASTPAASVSGLPAITVSNASVSVLLLNNSVPT